MTSTAVVPFSFEGAPVRAVVLDDGEANLVATDVADRLGYAKPLNAIKRHCKGALKWGTLQTAGGPQTVRIIGESDVMRLIISSKLEAAARFERLVFDEILPAIRRTGSYGQPNHVAALNDPSVMRGLLLSYTERTIALEAEKAALAPKADALDRIACTDGSMTITDAAKALQIAPKALFDWLLQNGWIYRRQNAKAPSAYQKHIDAGRLEHRTHTVTSDDGTTKTYSRVRVTPKGLATIAEAFAAHPIAA